MVVVAVIRYSHWFRGGGGWMVVVKKGATFCNGNGCIRSGPFLESTVVSVLKRETGEEE